MWPLCLNAVAAAVTWRGRIEGWNRLGRLNNESGVAERKGLREGGREIRHPRIGVDRNLNRRRREAEGERERGPIRKKEGASTINYLIPEMEPVLLIA